MMPVLPEKASKRVLEALSGLIHQMHFRGTVGTVASAGESLSAEAIKSGSGVELVLRPLQLGKHLRNLGVMILDGHTGNLATPAVPRY
jgi:hypothetical protein